MSMSSSSNTSTMSSSTNSVDLSTYQDDLENVLTWLLFSEESMEKQEALGHNVSKVKEQFNQHEVCLYKCLSVCLSIIDKYDKKSSRVSIFQWLQKQIKNHSGS